MIDADTAPHMEPAPIQARIARKRTAPHYQGGKVRRRLPMMLRDEIANIIKEGLDDYYRRVTADEWDVADSILALIAPELEKAKNWDKMRSFVDDKNCDPCPAWAMCDRDEGCLIGYIMGGMEVKDDGEKKCPYPPGSPAGLLLHHLLDMPCRYLPFRSRLDRLLVDLFRAHGIVYEYSIQGDDGTVRECVEKGHCGCDEVEYPPDFADALTYSVAKDYDPEEDETDCPVHGKIGGTGGDCPLC